jgi:2-polyprenyl-3-methyl-5-hydroxy-6-metoxy-1,4-benzoquinol methylase
MLHEFHEFRDFLRVTSDSKAWRKNGRLTVCLKCGAVQKPADPAWVQECSDIYAGYEIYHQSGGVEAQYFQDNSAVSANRSVRVIEALSENSNPPKCGRLLDFGCGNGALLRVAAKAFPAWELYGVEVSDKYRTEVLGIPQVAGFASRDLSAIPDNQNIITMVHVLEHLEDPYGALEIVKSKLAPGGVLLIEVPNYVENPFDFLIADHSLHFSLVVLTQLLQHLCFKATFASSTWVRKENTVLAVVGEVPTNEDLLQGNGKAVCDSVALALNWLSRVRDDAKQALGLTPHSLGIFGTANAARWVDAELDGGATFFVEEDPNRVGRKLEGRPVFAPHQVPAQSSVIIPIAPIQAQSVYTRLVKKCPDVHWKVLG